MAARRWRGLLRRGRAGWLILGALMLSGCYPLINDISTDRDDPPRYVVAPPDDPAYDAAALRGPTERAYPDLRNLALPQSPVTVFPHVVALVAQRGWESVAQEGGRGSGTVAEPWRVQAVAVTRWLRFRDDVVIEVRPGGDGGSVVAMRSRSRVGKGDFGKNAGRIRAFLADLRARLAGAADGRG